MKKKALTFWALSFVSSIMASVFLIIFFYGELTGSLIAIFPCINLLIWMIILPLAFINTFLPSPPPNHNETDEEETTNAQTDQTKSNYHWSKYFDETDERQWLLVAIYCHMKKSCSHSTLTSNPIFLCNIRLPHISRDNVSIIQSRFIRLGFCEIHGKSNKWLCKSYDDVVKALLAE